MSSREIKGKEKYPPWHLGFVVIGKGVFRSLLTTVTNFTYIYIYMYYKRKPFRNHIHLFVILRFFF